MNEESGYNTGILGFRANAEEPTPLYMQLATALRRLINQRDMDEGEALPAERKIMEATNLSRVTVRKAIDLLVKEGLLRQKRGSGTFVSDGLPKIEQPLSLLSSFTEDMLSQNHAPSARWLAKTLAFPTPEEVMLFGLTPGDKVLRLDRLRIGDGIPLAVEYTTVPASILASAELITHSLYEALEKVQARPVRATQRLKARALPAKEAALLDAATGEPAVYMERASRLKNGRVVEFTRSYFRSDTFEFVAELSISP